VEYEPVRAWVAQLVERVLGKDEVTGSIPVPGSSLWGVRMSGGNSGVESLPSKQMVAGSNPVPRSIECSAAEAVLKSYARRQEFLIQSAVIGAQS
jgi:hypothetical protein